MLMLYLKKKNLHRKVTFYLYNGKNEIEEVPLPAQFLSFLALLPAFSVHFQWGADVPSGCDRYCFELMEFPGSLLAYFDQIIKDNYRRTLRLPFSFC